MFSKSIDLVDRISPLPDAILGVILSFLLTKEAVATSVLSKRWKSVWVSVPCLDFHFYKDCSKIAKKDDVVRFTDFVSHVLHLHSCSLLNKFNFVWYPKFIKSSCVDTWINSVIAKNVRELSLRCVVRDGGPSKFDSNFATVRYIGSYVFPVNVFCCDSLHSLELVGCLIYIYDETVISLPKLECLTLSPVCFKSKKACETILNGCPLVKFLHLNIPRGDFECVISSDILISLKLFLEGGCRFKLRKAPALEYLTLDGCLSGISIDASLGSLVQADFTVSLYNNIKNNSIVEDVRAFDHAQVLTLSFHALQALAKATISLSTEFKRLVKLVAETCSSVLDFIHNSDNLQVLIIQKDDEDPDDCYFEYDSKRKNLGKVPKCLSNSLKEVRIYNYADLDDENEMIRFILQHGSVLEVMEVSSVKDFYRDGDFENHQKKLLRKICAMPKKSPVCQVLVTSSN